MLWAPFAAACAASLDDVLIQAPDEVLPLIEKSIAAAVESARLDDVGDVQQLYRRLRPIVENALGAQGYFSASIRRNREFDDLDEASPKLRMLIEPGEPSLIESVSIRFEGDLEKDSGSNEKRRKELMSLWQLSEGKPFNQSQWDSSKQVILDRLLAKDYPTATISRSLADVDPQANKVQLSVVYNSGPAFTFGELRIVGLEKYPERVVKGYNSIEPGEPYSQERLLQLLSDLQNTVYFSSVSVQIDEDKGPKEVPIVVEVVESDSQRIGLGAGYSSNTGFRSEVTYSLNNLFDRGYNLKSGIRLEQKRQSVFSDIFLPPTQKGVQDAVGFAYDQQQISDLETERTSIGVRREYITSPADFTLGVNFQLEERLVNGLSLGQTQALVAGASATRSRVDDRLNPTTGYVAFGQVALASENLGSDQDFFRWAGRFQQYWTPAQDHLISARFEIGAVQADSRRDIPQDYLFRTGGSNSVRGFRYLSIGVFEQGVLQGGRRLLVGSLEYTRWVRGPLGVAVFADAGDVALQ
ncbi:MAG: BamA/TamA family outer membrane protein, partial [Limnobacter sp.]|nr:BamA/TamA family outer membrane protein [Limnobacter sp.]